MSFAVSSWIRKQRKAMGYSINSDHCIEQAWQLNSDDFQEDPLLLELVRLRVCQLLGSFLRRDCPY